MANVQLWGEALKGMPRLDKAGWDDLDPIARWLVATRAAVLILTFSSAAVGGLIAARIGAFDWTLWGLCTLGLCLAHATNNLLNDLTDYWKGVDRDNYFRTQYGPQPLEHGLMSVRQLLGYAAVTGGAALAVGAYLVALQGDVVLWLLAAGAFFVLFYTYPLKYIGMGEVAVLLVWGPLMTAGTTYVVTGAWSWIAVLASLPHALGATAVIFGKHIDKLAADRAKGIRTLPVLLGDRLSRGSVVAMVLGQYAAVGAMILWAGFSPVLLVVLAAGSALRYLLTAYRAPRPEGPPPEYPKGVWPLWYVAFAFHHTRRFALLYLLGLAVDVLWFS